MAVNRLPASSGPLDDAGQRELPLNDVHVHRMRAAKLADACKAAALAIGFQRAARELDEIFEPLGHPVSIGTLRNALGDHERNYVRAEWVPYFAAISEEVAEIVAESAGRMLAAPRKLAPAEELELLRDRVTREFGAAGARLVANLGKARTR
jgi:hypothetical protein